ncbi:hypothetical protein Bbelb_250530 [Branchiostoma belcheri]|nr:hypothetical protein Bbelb_250530 [Branchiostoma belcheri]
MPGGVFPARWYISLHLYVSGSPERARPGSPDSRRRVGSGAAPGILGVDPAAGSTQVQAIPGAVSQQLQLSPARWFIGRSGSWRVWAPLPRNRSARFVTSSERGQSKKALVAPHSDTAVKTSCH